MFDNKLSEKYLRKRREKAIGTASTVAFWSAAVLIAGGAVYKAAITDSGREQLANLMGRENVIALLGDRPSKLEELQRQVFAQTRMREQGIDSIITASIEPKRYEQTATTNLKPVGQSIITGSIRPRGDLTSSTINGTNYIVELANSNDVGPLRDTLNALRKSYPVAMRKGVPNIRRHITADYPAGRYFLYLNTFSSADTAFESCNAYLGMGIPCATTAILSNPTVRQALPR